uniref:Bone morphogenetic protein 10, like n=1 Tax=Sinocyclocheilus rhinocerous TaxID=307959 RepID=A0A673J1H9_9TELE
MVSSLNYKKSAVMPVSGLSGAGCVCVLSFCVLLPTSARCGPPEERRSAAGVVDEVDMQEVLDQFLPDQGPRTEPPEYMLELYERFTSDRSAAPSANIVRSFRNEGEDALFVCFCALNTDCLKLSVFDARCERDPLASKHVHRRESGWEVFDMTSTVQHWRKIRAVTPRLEVRIENLQAFRNTNVDLDIDRNPDGKHEPALIVFSDNSSEIHQLERKEHETLLTQTRSNLIYDDGPRVQRSAKTEDCRKAEMYVDFKDIGWDSFVLAPSGYHAFTCRGAFQTLLNLKSPQRAAQACCVPTELKPISLLFENEHGVVVLNNKYEGMVVKECGCR